MGNNRYATSPSSRGSKRIHYLDALRIFAILAVIMIHVAVSQKSAVAITSPSFLIFTGYEAIAGRLAVPLFIMISGAMFLNPERPFSIKKFYWHNILRIVRVFLFWSFLYAIFHTIFRLISGSPWNEAMVWQFIRWLIFGQNHMWFLFLLVGLYLIVPLLRKITENHHLTLYFLILSFCFCLMFNLLKLIPSFSMLTDVMSRLDLLFVRGYVFYFVLGYFLHAFEIKKKVRFLFYVLGILSLIFTVLFTWLFSLHDGTEYRAFQNNLLPFTCFICVAVFLWFKTYFLRFQTKKMFVLTYASSLTFGIYLVHEFFNFAIQRIGFTTTTFWPIFSVPCITFLIFILSGLCTTVLHKIPGFAKYLL